MNVVDIELLDYYYDGNNIDWNKSVVGSLDVSSHSEFPLALTFSIADIKDISARKGTFSKTFKIPATKNNNLLYKNIYIANSFSTNNLTNKKPCRILFNNLYSINGLLQLSAVGLKDKPEYYSCVFYGENIGWATIIGDVLLKDLGYDGSEENTRGIGWNNLNGKSNSGKDLKITKEGISETWNNDDAEYKIRSNSTPSETAIVYPVTSYGDFNTSGEEYAIQLLDTKFTYYRDFTNTPVASTFTGYSGNHFTTPYGTPEPMVDWRPCIWVYDVFKEIFIQAGYKIESNFIESETFKKLLFALPNFKYNNADIRYDLFSLDILSNLNQTDTSSRLVFKNNITTTMNGTNSVNFVSEKIDFATSSSSGFNLKLGDTHFSEATDTFTAAEYGKYHFSITNNCLHLNAFTNSTSSTPNLQCFLNYARFEIKIKTVGESNYVVAGFSEGAVGYSFNVGTGNNGANLNTTSELEDFEQTIYLNKGDQVQFWFHVRGKPTVDVGSNTITGSFSLFAEKNISSGHTHDGRLAIAIDPVHASYGQTYDLKNVINEEYKQLDFIKGVSHAFNLQYTTDEASKTVSIEPFNDFYEPLSEAIDWSYKIDRSQDFVDIWVKQAFKRDVVFKYKTDSKDQKVEQRALDYFKEILDEYPYWETFSDNFERGITIFENPFFAGTFNAKDIDSVQGQTDPPFISCLWEAQEGGGNTNPQDWARPVQGYEFQPRLLTWKRYSPNGNDLTPKRATVQTWASNNQTVVANNNQPTTPSVLSKNYPQATSVNRDDSSQILLTYGNVWVRDYSDGDASSLGTYTAYQIGTGLYERFYKNMIEMIKYNPRVRTVVVSLKIEDIINLNLRKIIYIDGVYWRINKIIDYKPLGTPLTKVELIEWVDLGTPSSTTPQLNFSDGSWIPSGGAQDDVPNNYM
jgi:hypothetical protein